MPGGTHPDGQPRGDRRDWAEESRRRALVSIQTSQVTPPTPPTAYYVADLEDYGIGTGKVIRIDATTGVQTIVSSGGQFIDPYGVVEAPDGSLIVADQGLLGGTGTLFRVDPVTGAQTVITTNGYLIDPFEVVIAPDGSFLVADFAHRRVGADCPGRPRDG